MRPTLSSLIFLLLIQSSSAQTHFGGELLHGSPTPSNARPTPRADSETLRILDEQNRELSAGNRSTASLFRSITGGEEQARRMVQALQDEEMRQALEKVTVRGREFLQKNSALRNPLAFIGGAMSLWMGNTVRLVNEEQFKISTRVEGRSRSGEFSMESPLLNGRLRFNGGEGFSINMNREIPGLKSRAEIDYQSRTQSLTTQIRQPIAPHLDLTFGTSQIPQLNNQTDGRAKIEYQFQF
jgi:hypothetical protein